MSNPNSRLSCFVKREKALRNVERVLKLSDPRSIQGGSFEFSAICGPHVHALTKSVAHSLHINNMDCAAGQHFTYSCGMNTNSIGDWLTKAILLVGNDPVFVLDDQSRYDVHIHEYAFAKVQLIYKKYLPKLVARLMDRSYLNKGIQKGRTKTGVKYAVPYTMASGRPDTSLADTLINCMMKMHIHGKGGNWYSLVCGDDSVTVMPRALYDRLGRMPGIIAKYRALGFKTTGKATSNVEEVDFCSSVFRKTNASYVLVPKVGKTLARIFWDDKNRPVCDRLPWAQGIIIGLRQLAPLDPILAAALHGVGNVASRVVVDRSYEYKLQVVGGVDCDIDAFYSQMETMYRLSPDDIKVLIEYLRQSDGQWDHPFLDHIVTMDMDA
jgi:hypothetical protein